MFGHGNTYLRDELLKVVNLVVGHGLKKVSIQL